MPQATTRSPVMNISGGFRHQGIQSSNSMHHLSEVFSGDSLSTLHSFEKKSKKSISDTHCSASQSLLGLTEKQMNQASPEIRARWNQNFNTIKNMNHEMPSQQRSFFSRPQSLPELDRYFELHRGFVTNLDRLKTTPDLRRHKGVLSTDSVPDFMPNRPVPGGTMRNPMSGRPVKWNDHWQEPKSMKKKCLPVTLLFQCPGPPPPDMFSRGEDEG